MLVGTMFVGELGVYVVECTQDIHKKQRINISHLIASINIVKLIQTSFQIS